MPHENLNTVHAVAEDVRDAMQFMLSCKESSLCCPASAKLGDISGIQGSKENPTPVPKVCHSFGCIGCAAEKVARKADRVTPASFNKVALMTGESNSDEVFVIPRLRIALV